MQIRALFEDDDAVSPVIGVILMVAITVILAAVIGAFVLGFGGGGPSAPSVTWDAGTSNGTSNVTFAHSGGDTIDNPEEILDITGSGAGDDIHAHSTSGELSTGDNVTEYVGPADPSGEYLLVWEQDGSSQELSTYSA